MKEVGSSDRTTNLFAALLLRLGAAAILLGDDRVKSRLLLGSEQYSHLLAGSSTDYVVARAHIRANRPVVIAGPVEDHSHCRCLVLAQRQLALQRFKVGIRIAD